MDFVIYSMGSGAYLTEVLHAVNAITGSGDFVQLMQIGMVLGILILAFQALMSGGSQINLGQVATAFLLYALMFGPRVDVAVHGVYDRHNQAVADVPIGIAAPGAMVSQIGLGLTRMFETAFAPLTSSTAPTGLSQGGGFVDSLKVLNSVRRGASDTALLSAVDEVHPGFRRSWSEYLRNCTSTKVLRGDASIEEVYSAPFDETKGMRFDSQTFSTRVYDGSTSSAMSCTDAWGEINTKLDEVSSGTSFEEALRRLIRPEGVPAGAEMEGTIPDSASAEVNAALDMLGQNATQAQDFIRLALLEPIFIQSMGDRYKDFFDTNTAVMINQALDQRNVQWSSEQTVFMSVVRPMMTFIEGFAYSITPFAAFILLLGGFGMKLAIKYGQMLLWIQLWLPVLAMTNMYLHSVASMELSQLDDFSNSFYALNQADQQLAHWIGVGGMLAAATPILTLVLLTGSTYAMTSLAGRMHGAEHVNEKVHSPDAVQPGAVMSQASMYQHSAGSGRVMSGAEGSLLTFQVGQTAQDTMQSARQEMSQASQSLTGSIQQSFKQGETLTDSQGRTEMFNSALSGTKNEATTALSSAADSMSKELGLGTQQAQQLRAEMAANATLATPIKDIMAGLGLSGTLSKAQSFSADQSVSDAVSSMTGVNWGEQHSAQLSEALSHQVQGMSSEQLAESWGSENVESIQNAASEVRSASDSYNETSAIVQSANVGETVRADRMGQMITGKDGAAAELNTRFGTTATPEMKAQANERAARYAADTSQGGYGMSASNAMAVAQMEMLQNGNSEHKALFMSTLGNVTGGNHGEMPGAGASSNQGIGDGIATPGQVGGGATQGVPDPSTNLGPGGDRGDVEDHFGAASGEVADHHAINEAGQARERISSTIDEIGGSYSPGLGMRLHELVNGNTSSADMNGGGFANVSDGALSGTSGLAGLGSRDANPGTSELKQRMLSGQSGSELTSPSMRLGFGSNHSQAAAFGYGAMTNEERAEFTAGGGSVEMSSPAQKAAFAAGEAHRESGGSMQAAREVYNDSRVSNAAEYYSNRFSSAGVGAVAAAMHTESETQRDTLFNNGVNAIAREAATADGANYESLDDAGRERYMNYAHHVAQSVAVGMKDGLREGAAMPAERHSEVVRLSGQKR